MTHLSAAYSYVRLDVTVKFFTERVMMAVAGYLQRLWMPHSLKCLRLGWMGLWAIWSSSWQCCLWQGSLNLMILGEPSNQSRSMILWNWSTGGSFRTPWRISELHGWWRADTDFPLRLWDLLLGDLQKLPSLGGPSWEEVGADGPRGPCQPQSCCTFVIYLQRRKSCSSHRLTGCWWGRLPTSGMCLSLWVL